MSSSRSQEIPYIVNIGVDTYSPPISSKDFKVLRLKNLQPRLNRLIAATGLTELQKIEGQQIMAYASYTHPTSLYSGLYAITKTSIYVFDFASLTFDLTPIYAGFSDNNDSYAVVPWFDCVYVTKLKTTVKLAANVAVVVSTMPSARYAIASAGHMLMANIKTPGGLFPNTIINSDLYLPERFVIDTDSEADYFEMESPDGELTGLSYQRGNNLIYTRNSIWIATYSSGKYKFDPLFTGIGNVYHGAQVRVKEIDMFIADDGIYVIDGLQLRSIGDPIWEFFSNDIAVTSLFDYVRGRVDTRKFEVSWTYPKAGGALWSIVYNYKEDKWSDRDPQDILTSVRFSVPLRGFRTIDSFSDVIDTGTSSSYMIEGDWQYTTYAIRDLFGTSTGVIGTSQASAEEVNGDPINVELESFDLYYEETDDVKEISKIVVQFKEIGTAPLLLQVASRHTQADALVWSAPVALTRANNETAFYFRNLGVGKFLRFKFTCANTNDNALVELYTISPFLLVEQ